MRKSIQTHGGGGQTKQRTPEVGPHSKSDGGGEVHDVPQLHIIEGFVDGSLVHKPDCWSPVCVQAEEAVRDTTLERYCYNVNSRAARSASFATEPCLRAKRFFFLLSDIL